jgi:hypothetical protein
MCDGIDLFWTVDFAYPLQTGADIETGIKGRPVIFCNHDLADSVHCDVDSVACSREVIYGVCFDSREGEDLMVDGGPWDHEEVLCFYVRVFGLPHVH